MSIQQFVLLVLVTAVALVTAGHALLAKRDPRAAFGWVGMCLIFPVAGPLLYVLFGVNRVRTRAKRLDELAPEPPAIAYGAADNVEGRALVSLQGSSELVELDRISHAVTGQPLTGGNTIELLCNGEEAYPAMLAAIDGAEHRVLLATYIFETNATGRQFIDALARARQRGIDVLVLIDGVGEFYSLPRAGGLLRKQGVTVVRFLPPKLIPPSLSINLRNHRKVLVVDGDTAFTGGMNIGDRHLAANEQNPGRLTDIHFRLAGPVVANMEQAFVEDWTFCTGEPLVLNPRERSTAGSAVCRTILDGPGDEMDRLAMILIGAMASAGSTVRIMTPYFLPARELVAAMQNAALRGVDVMLVLPAKNNLRFVHWATRNVLQDLLQWGVEVRYQPPPFAHSKLLIVDDHYVQVGSANIDPRSLRLNFELAVEVYDKPFAVRLVAHFDDIWQRSRRATLDELLGRPLWVRLRDAVAWLFSPYM